jgi:hypothetical protein
MVQVAPNNGEVWFYRAAATSSSNERLDYLSKALSLSPHHTAAQKGMYETLKQYLEEDPFLRYMEENPSIYQVITGHGQRIVIAKERAHTPPYPPKSITALELAYRWLGYALGGLLLAGLGTVICALVAIRFASRAAAQSVSGDQWKRARLALVYASALLLIGGLLSFLFLLHL